MFSATSIRTSSRAYGGDAPVRSPDLDAKLASYRSQLEDWVTCPSAKTPEGKARIEQITTKFNDVKAQIKQAADDAKSTQAPAASKAPGRAVAASDAGPDAAATYDRPASPGAVSSLASGSGSFAPPGTRLDVFA